MTLHVLERLTSAVGPSWT